MHTYSIDAKYFFYKWFRNIDQGLLFNVLNLSEPAANPFNF